MSNAIQPLGAAPTANPLTQLPGALVGPAGKFYAFYSDSLKGTTGLVARLLWWMRSRDEGGVGLHPDDAATALRNLMRPEVAGKADYAGQILSALAREVEELVKLRKERESRDAFQRRSEQEAGEAVQTNLRERFLSGIGTPTE